jgi:hypothetical protein
MVQRRLLVMMTRRDFSFVLLDPDRCKHDLRVNGMDSGFLNFYPQTLYLRRLPARWIGVRS